MIDPAALLHTKRRGAGAVALGDRRLRARDAAGAARQYRRAAFRLSLGADLRPTWAVDVAAAWYGAALAALAAADVPGAFVALRRSIAWLRVAVRSVQFSRDPYGVGGDPVALGALASVGRAIRDGFCEALPSAAGGEALGEALGLCRGLCACVCVSKAPLAHGRGGPGGGEAPYYLLPSWQGF